MMKAKTSAWICAAPSRAARGVPEGRDVRQIPPDDLASAGGERRRLLRTPDDRADGVPSRAERLGDVAPDEPRRSCDEDLHGRDLAE